MLNIYYKNIFHVIIIIKLNKLIEEVSIARVEGNKQKDQKETPILIAARVDFSPVTIHDRNSSDKNIVYELLLKKEILTETVRCS